MGRMERMGLIWATQETAHLVSLGQAVAEAFEAVEALLEVGHAGGVAEADVVVGAKSDAGDGSDFLGFEEAGAEVGGLEAGLADGAGTSLSFASSLRSSAGPVKQARPVRKTEVSPREPLVAAGLENPGPSVCIGG
jgi:hypothetical protein